MTAPASPDRTTMALGRLPWRRLAALLVEVPWWLQALVVYFASRVVTMAIMAAVVQTQPPSEWSGGAEPTLRDFLNFWDAGWYQRIAEDGYPGQLPLDEAGNVIQNAWAFYPLHAWITRDIVTLTGMEYYDASPLVATVSGALASVAILFLFRQLTTAGAALAGLAFVFFFPTAAVFSVGYAESMTELALALALLLVLQRRYLIAIPVVFLMDLTRPIGVAFAFFMLAHLIHRFLSRRREPYPLKEVVTSWTLGVLSCVAALVHPFLAWRATGVFDAYMQTEAAWSGGHSAVIVQWFARAETLAGPFGPVLLFAVVGGMLWFVFSRPASVMGRTLQLWCLCYMIYLLLFFNPQTSTFRLLLPLFPMALTLTASRSWAFRAAVLVGFLLLQVVWVAWLWRYVPPVDLPP